LSRLVFLFSIILYLCITTPSYVYGSDINAQLNFLNLAEPRDDIESSHLEFDLKFYFEKASKDVFKKVEKESDYKDYTVVQGFNYVLDAGLYAATYFDYQITVPEAYVSFGSGSNLFSLGRKRANALLYVDEIFKLGVDQAFSRMNPFQPEDQGRLALSYILRSDAVAVELFVSPLSIPDQGANFEFKNGRVFSDNPWAVLPPSELTIQGTGNFDLSYDISDDSIPDLLSQVQYGASFSVLSELLKVDAFYFNKTAKQLGFNIVPTLDSDQVSEVDVVATPFFVREHTFGLQLKSRWLQGFEVTNGFYGLIVDSSDVDKDVEFQTELNDSFFVTNGFHFTFDWARLTLAHLYRTERSFKLNDNVIYLKSNRFLHGSAVKLSLSELKYKKFEFYSDVLFATEEKGLSALFKVSYAYSNRFRITSELNIIEDLNEDSSFESRLSESNFSRFSSLDSIRVGVNYVF